MTANILRTGPFTLTVQLVRGICSWYSGLLVQSKPGTPSSRPKSRPLRESPDLVRIYVSCLPKPKHPGASQVGPSTKYLSYRHIHGRLTQPSSSPRAACWSIKRQTSSSQPPTPFFFFVPFFSFSSVFAKCSSLCNCISAKVFRSSGNKGKFPSLVELGRKQRKIQR